MNDPVQSLLIFFLSREVIKKSAARLVNIIIKLEKLIRTTMDLMSSFSKQFRKAGVIIKFEFNCRQ